MSRLYSISRSSTPQQVQSSPVQDKEQATPGAPGGCTTVPTGAIAFEMDSDIFATCSDTKARERERGRKGGRQGGDLDRIGSGRLENGQSAAV